MSESGFWGSGWSFPPTFNTADNQLQLSHKVDNINQSIDIILSTLQGERSMMPYFGSNVRAFVFRNMDETAKGELIYSVKNSLLDYEPRISVNEVDITIEDAAAPLVRISVDYTVRTTNSRHNHVFPFSVNEGNNIQISYHGEQFNE